MYVTDSGDAASYVKVLSPTTPFTASTDSAGTYVGCSKTAKSGIHILQASEQLHMLAMMRYRWQCDLHGDHVVSPA